MDRRTLWALALLVACLSCAPRHAAGACTPLQLAHFKERWAGQKAPCPASKLINVTAGCAKWTGQAAPAAPANWVVDVFGSCGVGQIGSPFCGGGAGSCTEVGGWCVSDYKPASTFDQASLPDQDSPSLSYCCCPGR